ncbi:hypothetical protein BC941DRAFT_436866 [Chlamydoabsidia padenii]|nr:hypothetical protein BC941DRAFT_436866 [Chlamydoabsidia padenii]
MIPLFLIYLLALVLLCPISARPIYVNLNVYSRPNGKGMVQHIRPTDSSTCFNLQSRHIGSFDLNDPMIQLTFYRSKDCLGAPTRSIQPCTHPTKLMMKARSVAIKRIKRISPDEGF